MNAWNFGTRPIACVLAVVLTSGCAGSNQAAEYAEAAHAARARTERSEDRRVAPEAFATADREAGLAEAAAKEGDAVAAELYAERANAAYEHAKIRARLVRATELLGAAETDLARATATRDQFAVARRALDKEATDLEAALRSAREAELPRALGTADPAREKARLAAARALASQATLLCGATKLLAPNMQGLALAEEEAVRAHQATPAKAVDAAARARAACLALLTRTRRGAATSDDQADALLTELSRARVATVDPAHASDDALRLWRDERGVVVTLDSAFNGDALAPGAETTLQELGRVAAAHPSFAIQIVLRDQPARATGDDPRASAVTRGLVTGGANAKRLGVEYVGADGPALAPTQAGRRARGPRVEVVFVAPGSAK